MFHAIKSRWHSSSGYKDVLVLAIPLVITTSAGSLQSFIDRMFLSWFDPNALAATVPAALVSMTLTAVFLGLASYVGVFVAQYYGAREPCTNWRGSLAGFLHHSPVSAGGDSDLLLYSSDISNDWS